MFSDDDESLLGNRQGKSQDPQFFLLSDFQQIYSAYIKMGYGILQKKILDSESLTRLHSADLSGGQAKDFMTEDVSV